MGNCVKAASEDTNAENRKVPNIERAPIPQSEPDRPAALDNPVWAELMSEFAVFLT